MSNHLRLAWVFVVMMVIVSAAFNFSFGWRLGENSHTVTPLIHDGWIYGILSLSGDGLKVVMWVLCVTFFTAWRMSIGLRVLGLLTCGVIATCATLFSLNSAIGSISMNRTDMAGAREAKATNYDTVKNQLARAEQQLSWLDRGYRASVAIEADLAGLRQSNLWSRTASCTNVTVADSRAFCQRYSALQAELGTSQRSETLEANVTALRDKLAGMGGSLIADPHAKMLNQLTGYEQSTIVLAWLLLVVALVEGGSTLGPVGLAMAHRAIHARQEALPLPAGAEPATVATVIASVAPRANVEASDHVRDTTKKVEPYASEEELQKLKNLVAEMKAAGVTTPAKEPEAVTPVAKALTSVNLPENPDSSEVTTTNALSRNDYEAKTAVEVTTSEVDNSVVVPLESPALSPEAEKVVALFRPDMPKPMVAEHPFSADVKIKRRDVSDVKSFFRDCLGIDQEARAAMLHAIKERKGLEPRFAARLMDSPDVYDLYLAWYGEDEEGAMGPKPFSNKLNDYLSLPPGTRKLKGVKGIRNAKGARFPVYDRTQQAERKSA